MVLFFGRLLFIIKKRYR